MNNYFDEKLIEQYYPEAGQLMFPSMMIWKLPAGKEHMLSEVCSNGEYFLEEKIDGAFYQFVKTEHHEYVFGRTVSKTTGILTEKGSNIPHIVDALSCIPAGTIIIGEIYVPGGTSKDTTHIMGCLPAEAIKRQEKEGYIHYYCHDIIAYDGISLINEGAETRYKILEAIWKLHSFDSYNFLRLATKVDIDLEAEVSRILEAGGEGVVLKKRNAPYTPGKRPAWNTIKCKQMDSIDLVCMGLCPPTKEYTGKELEFWEYWEVGTPTFYDCFEENHCFGGWEWEKIKGKHYNEYSLDNIDTRLIVETDRIYRPITKYYYYGWPSAIQVGAYDQNGDLKLLGTVSSGLTDEDKQNMKEHPDNYISKVVSLDCMSISKSEKTLRHPVFKSWRLDKNPQECQINEIF